MAALHETTTTETLALDALLPGWRDLFAPVAWRLYDSLDPEQAIITIKKWVLSYTFRVRDAKPLVTLLFGAHP